MVDSEKPSRFRNVSALYVNLVLADLSEKAYAEHRIRCTFIKLRLLSSKCIDPSILDLSKPKTSISCSFEDLPLLNSPA